MKQEQCLKKTCRGSIIANQASYGSLRQLHTKLLDQLFVLVELLKSLDVHVWQFSGFGLVTVLLVSQDAHRELWPGESLQPAHQQNSSTPPSSFGSEAGYGSEKIWVDPPISVQRCPGQMLCFMFEITALLCTSNDK